MIIAAMDADTEGRKLAELVQRAVELTGRGDLHLRVEEPDHGKDWNDRLRLERITTGKGTSVGGAPARERRQAT